MTIESLCRQYTDLNREEISIIEQISCSLQLLANLEDADVFIDCPCVSGDAVVVAEAKPSYVPSSYEKNVAGLIARHEDEPAVARTLHLGVATKRMRALTQESSRVTQSVEPIRNGNRVIGVLIIEKRTSEQGDIGGYQHDPQLGRGQLTHSLVHLEDESNWLMDCIDEALIMVDKNGVVVSCNSLAHSLYRELGHVEDVLGQLYENIRLTEALPAVPGECAAAEVSAGQHFLMVKHIKLDSPNISLAAVIRDITGIKEQEKELILRSVAIKEMHHRIKNNLQTIASLLRLQIRRSENDDTSRVLQESMNRILSIAATHELLAQSGVDQVKICEVIVNIKNNTMRYFSRLGLKVLVYIEGDDFEVDSDLATSVALVINELLQNSLQYAFDDRHIGEIRIIVEKGGLYSQIQVIDNGCGFDLRNVQGNRLGLSIVQTLVKDKLRGDLYIRSDKQGTAVKFSFRK